MFDEVQMRETFKETEYARLCQTLGTSFRDNGA